MHAAADAAASENVLGACPHEYGFSRSLLCRQDQPMMRDTEAPRYYFGYF